MEDTMLTRLLKRMQARKVLRMSKKAMNSAFSHISIHSVFPFGDGLFGRLL
jgi:hypothetical protein